MGNKELKSVEGWKIIFKKKKKIKWGKENNHAYRFRRFLKFPSDVGILPSRELLEISLQQEAKSILVIRWYNLKCKAFIIVLLKCSKATIKELNLQCLKVRKVSQSSRNKSTQVIILQKSVKTITTEEKGSVRQYLKKTRIQSDHIILEQFVLTILAALYSFPTLEEFLHKNCCNEDLYSMSHIQHQ